MSKGKGGGSLARGQAGAGNGDTRTQGQAGRGKGGTPRARGQTIKVCDSCGARAKGNGKGRCTSTCDGYLLAKATWEAERRDRIRCLNCPDGYIKGRGKKFCPKCSSQNAPPLTPPTGDGPNAALERAALAAAAARREREEGQVRQAQARQRAAAWRASEQALEAFYTDLFSLPPADPAEVAANRAAAASLARRVGEGRAARAAVMSQVPRGEWAAKRRAANVAQDWVYVVDEGWVAQTEAGKVYHNVWGTRGPIFWSVCEGGSGGGQEDIGCDAGQS